MQPTPTHRTLLLLLFYFFGSCSAEETVVTSTVAKTEKNLLVLIDDFSASYPYRTDTNEVQQLLAELTGRGSLTVAVLHIMARGAAEQEIFRTDFTPGRIEIDRSSELSFFDARRNQQLREEFVAREQRRFAYFTRRVIAELDQANSQRALTSDVEGVFVPLNTFLQQPEFVDYQHIILVICSDLEHDLDRARPLQPIELAQHDYLFIVRPKYVDLPLRFPNADPIPLTDFRAVSILSLLHP